VDNWVTRAQPAIPISHPGRIGLTQIHGDLGKAIRFGQWLNGSGFSKFEHAFLDLGNGTLIEAEPGGARVEPLSKYAMQDVYWCDSVYATLTEDQKFRIVNAARLLRGTPYSFLDYAALFTHRLHIPVPGLRDFIADTHHEICSQLVDFAYNIGGAPLFQNRWTGYVTPGDLWKLDMAQVRRIESVPCGICGSHGFCSQCTRR
jgi:uncharacterized protein YycO